MSAKKDFLFDPKRNPLFREDYHPSEYKIPQADIRISLDEDQTVVRSHIWVKRNPDLPNVGGPLILDGEALRLKSIQINDGGKLRHLDPSEYLVTDKNLILKNPPAGAFDLEIVTEMSPKENTALSGIYQAGDIICSQNEAQGFRRITYFLDRPDNLTKFTVTLSGDKQKYPVLLSNGNGDYKSSKDLGDGKHAVTWTDPWPKPSYLFAVVGGNLEVLEDEFITMSGKKVALRIFVQHGYEDKIHWAMDSIKRAMKWDEERYGREYDLDMFHIVAVDKFNAGAMENKGLNIFNVKALVGDKSTMTDSELIYIERVVAHEYFHNWTGDRVTLRDWFELTLKEGLTVLRDRQFTGDMHSGSIKRIEDAIGLRTRQFMEDASSLSHSIRPDRVEEFNNIYSGTVYDKGSHVLDMLHTMMGETTWRAATDEYFNRFDGMAVSCDDFLDVMEDVSGLDLTQFRRWYSQSGTPQVEYIGSYDPATQTYRLTITQETLPTADQDVKQPLHMPIAVGLIGESGKDIPLRLVGEDANTAAETTRILHVTEASQTFEFTHVPGPVVPSFLRNFSAPVNVVTVPSDDELTFRMAHDSDSYNRFEAAERLMVKTLRGLIADTQAGRPLQLPQALVDAYGVNVENALDGDLAFSALILQMPSADLLNQSMKPIDPDAVKTAMSFMKETLAKRFETEFTNIYAITSAPQAETYAVNSTQVGRRSLHNLALGFLAKLDDSRAEMTAQHQYNAATNMTEKLAAVEALSRLSQHGVADTYLDKFYQEYKGDNALMDKWLLLSAANPNGDVLGRVRALMNHPAYDKTNPNKVYALLGGFMAGNTCAFHAKDGSGYKLLADTIIDLNGVNAHTGAILAKKFTQVGSYDAERQQAMAVEMRRIMADPAMDNGIKEIVGKALERVPKPPAGGPSPSASFGQAA